MTETILEYSRNKLESQRKLRLDRATRDALADLCRQRWASNTAKFAAREWGLTLDEARGVVLGRCSFTTYDKIIKRGGLSVALPIVEAVTGQSIARYIIELRETHNEHAERLAALAGGGRTVPRTWSDPATGLDLREADGRQSVHRRVG